MARVYLKQLITGLAITSLVFGAISCRALATNEEFFGKTTPPARNILRYVNGAEPETLDPAVSSGQPEARIYMALYEGLVEYDPRSLNAIPAIAERWDVNKDSSEFVFHLRRNARWSNGDPISAHDFVYSIRRAISPEVLSRTASLAYYIKYAQALNQKSVFVRDPQTAKFLLEQDFAAGDAALSEPLSQKSLDANQREYEPTAAQPEPHPDTAFHQVMHSPGRLFLPADEKKRSKLLAGDAKLASAVAGKELVKVRGEDIGVEAVDDYTVRISLSQPAPYFVDLMAHQLFRLVPRKIIEKYGEAWTEQENIITCGAFKLKSWKPYNELVVERDPMYWDAANVHLDEIHFYYSTDHSTSMNLYKVGEADALTNHGVPNPWLDVIRPKKDFMDGAESAITYLLINTTQPPMNDLRVRRAFNMAIDKATYSKSKQTTKPLSAFTPEGIFVGYPQPKGDPFNPEEARKLLGEAGYPVTRTSEGFECEKFPAEGLTLIFASHTANKALSEFMQAQWIQNLGITIPLSNMEAKTYMAARSKLEYKGFALALWGGDYMDPTTFLNLFLTPGADNGSGWWDQKYVDLLEEANHTIGRQKRYELLAKAEKYMLDAQPMIPIETPSVNWVKKPYVKGLYPNPTSLFAWKFVCIERDKSKWDYKTPSLAGTDKYVCSTPAD